MSDNPLGLKEIWVWNCSELDWTEMVKYSCLSHEQPLCIACTLGLHSTCNIEEVGDVEVIFKVALMAEQILLQSVTLKDNYRLYIKFPGIEEHLNMLLDGWNRFKENYRAAAERDPVDTIDCHLIEKIINNEEFSRNEFNWINKVVNMNFRFSLNFKIKK